MRDLVLLDHEREVEEALLLLKGKKAKDAFHKRDIIGDFLIWMNFLISTKCGVITKNEFPQKYIQRIPTDASAQRPQRPGVMESIVM